MRQRNKPFEEIYDLFAIRIIVKRLEECYYVLGIVHSLLCPFLTALKITLPRLK